MIKIIKVENSALDRPAFRIAAFDGSGKKSEEIAYCRYAGPMSIVTEQNLINRAMAKKLSAETDDGFLEKHFEKQSQQENESQQRQAEYQELAEAMEHVFCKQARQVKSPAAEKSANSDPMFYWETKQVRASDSAPSLGPFSNLRDSQTKLSYVSIYDNDGEIVMTVAVPDKNLATVESAISYANTRVEKNNLLLKEYDSVLQAALAKNDLK